MRSKISEPPKCHMCNHRSNLVTDEKYRHWDCEYNNSVKKVTTKLSNPLKSSPKWCPRRKLPRNY